MPSLSSSGGQPALGARSTTLVLRQFLPAFEDLLNISLETLSRTRTAKRAAKELGRGVASRVVTSEVLFSRAFRTLALFLLSTLVQ